MVSKRVFVCFIVLLLTFLVSIDSAQAACVANAQNPPDCSAWTCYGGGQFSVDENGDVVSIPDITGFNVFDPADDDSCVTGCSSNAPSYCQPTFFPDSEPVCGTTPCSDYGESSCGDATYCCWEQTWAWDGDRDGLKASGGSTQESCTDPGVNWVPISAGVDCDDTDPSIRSQTTTYRDSDRDGYSNGITQTRCPSSTWKLPSQLTATWPGAHDCNDDDENAKPVNGQCDDYCTAQSCNANSGAATCSNIDYQSSCNSGGNNAHCSWQQTGGGTCSSNTFCGAYDSNGGGCDGTEPPGCGTSTDENVCGPSELPQKLSSDENDGFAVPDITGFNVLDPEGGGSICCAGEPTCDGLSQSSCNSNSYCDWTPNGACSGSPRCGGASSENQCNFYGECSWTVTPGNSERKITCLADNDGDGYPMWQSHLSEIQVCGSCPGGYVQVFYDTVQDCNDNNRNVYPGATEVCNNIDDNCDSNYLIDEGFDKTWYFDPDDDGYGDGTTVTSCSQPSSQYKQIGGMTETSTDCNNNDGTIHPSHADSALDSQNGFIAAWCNGVDNNCDGQGTNAFAVSCYRDGDVDGWYSTGNSYQLCSVNHLQEDVCNTGDVSEHFYTTNYDQDDTDWRITYLACSAGQSFVDETVNYLGSYPFNEVDANDYALNYKPPSAGQFFEKFTGACQASNNFCVTGNLYENNFGNTFGSGFAQPGAVLSSNRVTVDQTAYCSDRCDAYGCEILDCDSDSNTCSAGCGLTWAPPGESYTNIGEYGGRLRSECCGDDANEAPVFTHCAGSETKDTVPTICCPIDGNDYFIHNNECVLECPDVMNTKPTWVATGSVDAPIHQAYEASFQGGSWSYCCDGTAGNKGPLCEAGRIGCYIQLEIANQGEGKKTYCDTAATDDYCLLEACLNGDTYEFCEQVTTCSDEFRVVPHVLGDERDLCTSYSVIPEPVENSYYAQLPNGCSAANVNNCEATAREVCTGVSCDVLCQRDGAGNVINCQESCESYSCQTVVSYHGPYCTFDPGCEPLAVQQEVINTIDVESVSSCSSYTTCNEFGCSCGECTEFGCPNCNELFVKSVSCSDQEFCGEANCNAALGSTHTDNLYCFDNLRVDGYNNNYGNELVVKVSGNNQIIDPYFQCDPTAGIEQGDPICQYGQGGEYGFDSGTNSCSTVQDICGQSVVINGVVQPYADTGCQDITLAADDAYGLYDVDCVAGTNVPNSYSNVYDAACCSAYTINELNVYEENTGNVVVY